EKRQPRGPTNLLAVTLTAVSGDLQIVGHREDTRYTIGSQVSDIFVGLAVDNALQGNVAVIHDDVNGWVDAHAVALQHRISIDGSHRAPAYRIIEARKRQDLNLIDDLLHALDTLHHVLSVGFQHWPHDISIKSYGVAVNGVAQIVKNRIVGQHEQLVTDLLDDAALVVHGRIRGWGCRGAQK